MAALGALALVGAVVASDVGSANATLNGPPRELAAGGGVVYAVDRGAGTVQWLDAKNLAPRGDPLQLGGPIGRPLVDPEGVLWAVNDRDGTLVAAARRKVLEPIHISGGGSRLQLTLAYGTPVVVDGVAATATVVQPDGTRYKIRDMAIEVQDIHPDSLLIPDVVESAYVPVYSVYERRLGVVDVIRQRAVFLDLSESSLFRGTEDGVQRRPDVPVTSGPRILMPDGAHNGYYLLNADFMIRYADATDEERKELATPFPSFHKLPDTGGQPIHFFTRGGMVLYDSAHSPVARPIG